MTAGPFCVCFLHCLWFLYFFAQRFYLVRRGLVFPSVSGCRPILHPFSFRILVFPLPRSTLSLRPVSFSSVVFSRFCFFLQHILVSASREAFCGDNALMYAMMPVV